MITTLRIKKEFDTSLELAVKWYSIVSILNNFKWTCMQVNILSFTAVKGDISSSCRVADFCSLFNTTSSSVANCVSELYKKGFIVKQGKTKVHPQLLLDFNNNILTQLALNVR